MEEHMWKTERAGHQQHRFSLRKERESLVPRQREGSAPPLVNPCGLASASDS